MKIIDKFGRPLKYDAASCGSGKRGPPGLGYSLDEDGNYNLKNKRLKLNSFEPINNFEAVNLFTLRKYTLHKLTGDDTIDAGNHVIKNVKLSEDPSSVVNKDYIDHLYPMSIKQEHKDTVLLCGDKRLVGLHDGINQQDAVTLNQTNKYIEVLRKRISGEIETATSQIIDSYWSLPLSKSKPVSTKKDGH